ncbi:MAG: hypothetical protein ACK4GA_06020 [Acinetobacter sp.]|uniref:hypothetical protein n=1 Tax=Acinetobacter sp. TaxID=472 RepID=UPI00391C0A69
MKNYKSFNQWMGEQGFNALRHANCCRIAYEGGQESMKIRIDEVQESNLNLEGECVQLQNRIDTALALIDTSSYAEMQRRLPDFMDQLKEALRGDHE